MNDAEKSIDTSANTVTEPSEAVIDISDGKDVCYLTDAEIELIALADVVVLEDKPKFELGTVVVTDGVDLMMGNDISFQRFVQASIGKYAQCEWGDTCDEDKISNNEALKDGERILAVYICKETNTTIWIITEWDRSVTTILFPDEY